MKIKDTIVITKVDNYYVLVDTAQNNDRFNGVVKLNETGKILCDFLSKDISYEALIQNMLDTYDVDKRALEKDVNNTINKLKEINMIID